MSYRSGSSATAPYGRLPHDGGARPQRPRQPDRHDSGRRPDARRDRIDRPRPDLCDPPRLLRPGAITREETRRGPGRDRSKARRMPRPPGLARSPGQMAVHYAAQDPGLPAGSRSDPTELGSTGWFSRPASSVRAPEKARFARGFRRPPPDLLARRSTLEPPTRRRSLARVLYAPPPTSLLTAWGLRHFLLIVPSARHRPRRAARSGDRVWRATRPLATLREATASGSALELPGDPLTQKRKPPASRAVARGRAV